MKVLIHNHMLMNQQSVSVTCTSHFLNHLKKISGETNIHLHASNVYLFQLPVQGEITELSEKQKRFIFKEELSIYEEQFEFESQYDSHQFSLFFNLQWHGVNYHIDIENL